MLVSRCISTLKRAKCLARPAQFHTSSIRNSDAEWFYRGGVPKHPKVVLLGAEIIGGVAWWWILWHLFTEYEHITGEFEYPDPSKWTDEELGIPSE